MKTWLIALVVSGAASGNAVQAQAPTESVRTVVTGTADNGKGAQLRPLGNDLS